MKCSQEKEDATQRKTLKQACYKSKEKGSVVDAWSQHPIINKIVVAIEVTSSKW